MNQTGEYALRGPAPWHHNEPEARYPSEAAEDDLGVVLSDVWCAGERESWHIDFDNGADVAWPWTVLLEWTQEGGSPHGADWTTYTWQFYGETVERALTEAIEWAKALEPWRPCPECDGAGIVPVSGRGGDGYDVCPECGPPPAEDSIARIKSLTDGVTTGGPNDG